MINILSCSNTLGNCCSNSGIVLFLDAMRKIMNLIQIIVPILLMIMATISFTKMVMNPERKNGLKNIQNMFLAAAIVFFIPVLVTAVLNMMPESFDISSCWQQAKSFTESNRSFSFDYISPYEVEEKSSLIDDPSEYEKGKPKPTPQPTPSSGGGSYTPGEVIAPGDVSGILEGAEKVHTMYEKINGIIIKI